MTAPRLHDAARALLDALDKADRIAKRSHGEDVPDHVLDDLDARRAALRTELSALEAQPSEVDRLREAIVLLTTEPDGLIHTEAQDELVKLGVLVRVPPNEEERAKWGLEEGDDWYVFSWSERAMEGYGYE